MVCIYTHLSMCLNTAGTLKTIQLLLSLSTSAPYQVGVHACNDLTVYVHMHCHSLCDALSPVLPVTANHVTLMHSDAGLRASFRQLGFAVLPQKVNGSNLSIRHFPSPS